MRQIRLGSGSWRRVPSVRFGPLVVVLSADAAAAEALKTDKAVLKRIMVRTAILLAHPVKG